MVTINGITSVCKNSNCSYTYNESSTPVVHSISPNSGVVCNYSTCHRVQISCTGCESGAGNNTVLVGDAPCDVVSVTTTEVVCCLGELLLKLRFLHQF